MRNSNVATSTPGAMCVVSRRAGVAALGFLLGACLAGGCEQKESAPEIVSLEGTVQKIDLKEEGTGEITVAYYSEKQKQQQIGAGQVDRNTEIRLNGASATLADLRIGDRVRGDVRVTKVKGATVRTVLKIQVDRAGGASGN